MTINDQYRKEVSSAFEAGIKGSILDNRITFDLAGYYTKIDDMQFFEFFVGSFGLLRVVSNIDKVDVKGAELNVTGRVVDGWTVFGSVNVTDSEIKQNASRPYTVGNKSPYTADWTINLGTQIDAPLNSTHGPGVACRLSHHRPDLVPQRPGRNPPDDFQRAAAHLGARAARLCRRRQLQRRDGARHSGC